MERRSPIRWACALLISGSTCWCKKQQQYSGKDFHPGRNCWTAKSATRDEDSERAVNRKVRNVDFTVRQKTTKWTQPSANIKWFSNVLWGWHWRKESRYTFQRAELIQNDGAKNWRRNSCKGTENIMHQEAGKTKPAYITDLQFCSEIATCASWFNPSKAQLIWLWHNEHGKWRPYAGWPQKHFLTSII